MGESNSGKTSIANRISKDTFSDDLASTIGSCQFEINHKLDHQPVNYYLWDTAGQEKYRSLIPSYTRDADIILLVFDLSASEPFSSIDTWYQILKQTLVGNPLIILIGNKVDLGIMVDKIKIEEVCKQITKDMSTNFKNTHETVYLSTSAKTGEGISDLVHVIDEFLLEINHPAKTVTQQPQQPLPLQKLSNNDAQRNKCC